MCSSDLQGVAADYAKAREWLLRASAKNEPLAWYNLALMAEQGQGEERNESEALALYAKAAEQGVVLAQSRLGWLLQKNGKTEDAVRWLGKAAEAGDITAQNNLGVILEQGQGMAKNLNEAARWYRKAAEAGDKVAQHNLGVLYRDGLGVERNENEALAWFQKSAEQGYAKAQLNLGQLYEKLATQKEAK